MDSAQYMRRVKGANRDTRKLSDSAKAVGVEGKRSMSGLEQAMGGVGRAMGPLLGMAGFAGLLRVLQQIYEQQQKIQATALKAAEGQTGLPRGL